MSFLEAEVAEESGEAFSGTLLEDHLGASLRDGLPTPMLAVVVAGRPALS